ncbi:MAG: spore germination protein, partial [Clostridia bacterium]|nr:spore germination protein [Clostridia bacterium]
MQDKYKQYKEEMERILKVDKSFDLIRRRMKSKSGRSMTFFYIDGFTKDMVMQKMMEYFIKVETVEDLTVNIPYVEIELTDDIDTAVRMVLSGSAALLAEGIDKIIILDTREYPVRSIQEPENDRVLRGPRDGFCETLIFNTALIRRRVRDPDLVMDVKNIGEKSRTDVVLCYIEGR